MGKFNLLTTLTVNAAGMTAGLAEATAGVKGFADGTKAQSSILTASFRDVSEMGIGEMRKEMMKLKQISFAGKSVEEVTAIKQRMGDLQDTMGDLRAEMAVMGGPGIGAMIGGFKFAMAGVEGLVGSLKILGVENAVVDNLSNKMVQMIGVMQAVGEIEDLVNSGKLKAIALKLQDMAVTAAQTVATASARAVQWLYNAALGATFAIVGGVVIAVAALVAGVYYLVQALSDSTDEMLASIGVLNRVGEAHASLFKTIKDNSLKALDLHMQNLVATGAITQKDYDLWKALEQKKSAMKEVYQKRSEALYQLWDDNEIQKKGKHGADLLKLEQVYEAARMGIIADGNKAAASVTSAYEEEVKAINAKAAATAAGAGAYDNLNTKISTLETKIKNVLATGGVVPQAWIDQLEALKGKVNQANTAFEKLSKHSGPKMEAIQGKDTDKVAETEKVEGGILKIRNKYGKLYDKQKLEELKKQKEIDKEGSLASIGALSETMGIAQGLFAENTAAHKVAAIAQAGMDTYLAANQALASAPPPYNFILMGAVIAAGIANTAKIMGFATGGIVGGQSFSGDMVPIRVNSGEMILNASQQANLWNAAQYGGGNSGGELTTRVSGSDLVIVLNNHARKVRNTR